MLKIIFGILVSVILLSFPMATVSQSPIGVWETGQSHVEVYKCKELLCGRIIALAEPLDKDGEEKTDKNNPDSALKSRLLIGMNFMEGFSQKSDKNWEGGTVYDPRNGKTYKCKMTLKNDGTLKVRGYVGISMFGRTVAWSRVKK